jgi:hypothetical protein
MNEEGPALFEEKQGPALWVRAVLLAMPLAALAFSYIQFVLGHPLGNRPMSDGALGILDFALVAGFVLLWRLQLVTRVYRGSIRVRLWPFANRVIPAGDIAHYEVRTYRPVRDYGGWGLREGIAGDTAYTMSGNKGVQLELRGAKSILIGSQRPEDLAAAIGKSGLDGCFG